MVKIDHRRIGMVNETWTDIVQYAHERHRVGECKWCDFIRVENITGEFMRRLELVGDIKHLYMWSLGSSLTDSAMNRKLILKRWDLFRKRMNHVTGWNPVFRVIEVGRRGFLHFHVINTDFCQHSIVLACWRSLTRERSNVHVSGHKGNLKPERLARYLMKYLSKSSSQYRWMGSFYGLDARCPRKVSNKANRPRLIYGGEVYGGYTTEAQTPRKASQKHI